ncbi:Neuropeptide capa receptor [Acromyrmex echinatior]|uniref:Neuropeptide capa receptor n=1 Tax=Acromyrmex echinatior TaxID=103372 RepID=F4W9A8_ACREC|nr:Neuropeptide capa receptor [Acromyrmex echinatior]
MSAKFLKRKAHGLDLVQIVGLPNELSVFWQQYPWTLGVGLCKIRAYVSEMSSYVSVLTIVVFSLERYLAICHPLHLYAMSGLKRPVRFILGAWLLALIFALPFAAYTTVNYIEYPPNRSSFEEEYKKNRCMKRDKLIAQSFITLQDVAYVKIELLIPLGTLYAVDMIISNGVVQKFDEKPASRLMAIILSACNYIVQREAFHGMHQRYPTLQIFVFPRQNMSIFEPDFPHNQYISVHIILLGVQLCFRRFPIDGFSVFSCIVIYVKRHGSVAMSTHIISREKPERGHDGSNLTAKCCRALPPSEEMNGTFQVTHETHDASFALVVHQVIKKDKRYVTCFMRSGRHSEESAMCAMLLPNMPKFPLYELSCLIFFFVPMLSIAVLYVRMGLRIQSNGLGRSIEGSVHGETRQAQSRKAIIRMLKISVHFHSIPQLMQS